MMVFMMVLMNMVEMNRRLEFKLKMEKPLPVHFTRSTHGQPGKVWPGICDYMVHMFSCRMKRSLMLFY